MKKLLIATHNPAKLHELKKGLQNLKQKGVIILTLKDLAISHEPEENGKTFQENAEIKARYYGNLVKLPTIADDGGLIIPILNNEPGVKSRRWLGYEASDDELIKHTLKLLTNISEDKRVAYLQTYICHFDPDKSTVAFATKKVKGYIAQKPSNKRLKGYPFRSLFIVSAYNKYYDELTHYEHGKINHRLIALRILINKINL